MSTSANPVRRYPLTSYVVLACLFGWILFIASALGAGIQPNGFPIGPIIAAAIVTALLGRAELSAWWHRLLRLRAGLAWYALALIIPVAIILLAVAANTALGAPAPTASQLAGWTGLPGELLGILILIGIGEEAGWTAFAAERLLDGRGFLGVWLALAAMRILWHVPLMLSGDLPWVLGVVGNAAFQLLVLWLYVRSGRRWFVAAVFHSVLNATSGSFFFQMVQGADNARLGVLMSAGYAILAAVVYALDRRRLAGLVGAEGAGE